MRDRETLEPATEENRRDLRTPARPRRDHAATGDQSHVLKIKPPLCLTYESASFFASMLDKVLSEGW